MIEDYLSWEVVTMPPQAVVEGLRLESRFHISFWDALILWAAEASGAAVLYSEDLIDGQQYGLVKVVNPLKNNHLGPIR
jgi:predicted nucleic acid-binding protein